MATRERTSMRFRSNTEPSPVPGCAACLSLANHRQNARSVFDHSAVSDANVNLRRHISAEHGERGVAD
jgi:sulfur transfer protein SufE